ncbi:IS110 family transposase [Falsiroseomonas sp.]|uniref:IS110 family transposase n=1 Tax=Falsiroseomonas sp. TaxID=2870721 RepID=UPI0035636488
MFAGIDVASETHTLARLDDAGAPIGRPIPITEDRAGYDALLAALGDPPALIVLEATGHYWKNLFAVLTAAGHDVALVNPLVARRFQEAGLERTKTDAIDAAGLARLAFEKRPAPMRLHDEVAEALRELVRHRDRLRQDFDDRVHQLHRLVDLGFPEFTRYVRTLASQLATCLLAEYPTAQAFARATPRRLAKLRYDGRHLLGPELATQLVEAAKRSIGQHHGPAYALQARHICQDLDLWRRRLAEIERDIENLLDTHEVGKLLTTIDGIGPQTTARIIAEVGNPARFHSPGALAAHLGVVPALRQSGKRNPARAAATHFGNTRLRTALWMPTLSAVRRNPWLRTFYERLRAAGKPPKLALVAAMRKLLLAVYVTARSLRPFVSSTEQARPA